MRFIFLMGVRKYIMGTKIYCEKCKRDFVVYHTDLEMIKTWPDLYSDCGGEWESRMYSCPRCDEILVKVRSND